MGLSDGILVVVSVLEGKFDDNYFSFWCREKYEDVHARVNCNLQYTSDSPRSFPKSLNLTSLSL